MPVVLAMLRQPGIAPPMGQGRTDGIRVGLLILLVNVAAVPL